MTPSRALLCEKFVRAWHRTHPKPNPTPKQNFGRRQSPAEGPPWGRNIRLCPQHAPAANQAVDGSAFCLPWGTARRRSEFEPRSRVRVDFGNFKKTHQNERRNAGQRYHGKPGQVASTGPIEAVSESKRKKYPANVSCCTYCAGNPSGVCRGNQGDDCKYCPLSRLNEETCKC